MHSIAEGSGIIPPGSHIAHSRTSSDARGKSLRSPRDGQVEYLPKSDRENTSHERINLWLWAGQTVKTLFRILMKARRGYATLHVLLQLIR